jgi:hypothetical protein
VVVATGGSVELEVVVRSAAELDGVLREALSLLPTGGELVVSVVGSDGAPSGREVVDAIEEAGLQLSRVVEVAEHALVVVVASAVA